MRRSVMTHVHASALGNLLARLTRPLTEPSRPPLDPPANQHPKFTTSKPAPYFLKNRVRVNWW